MRHLKAPQFAPLLLLALACGDNPSLEPGSPNDPSEAHDAGDIGSGDPTTDGDESTAMDDADSAPSDHEPSPSEDASVPEERPDASQPQPTIDAGETEGDAGPLCFVIQTVPGPNVPSCLSDEAWKERAEQECTRGGLELESITTGGTCEGGKVSATYVCCEPPTVDAGVDEPAQECVDAHPGFNPGAPCRTPDELEQRAANSCTGMGLELKVESLEFMFECAGGYKVVAYSCCP